MIGALMVAGCDQVMAGEAIPVAGQELPAAATPSKSATSDYSLARLCELISADEARSLGGSTEGEKKNSTSDGHAICTWSDSTHLVVGFQDGTSTAQADTGPAITNTPTTIDGLTAVQSLLTDTVVICEVMVDLPSGKMFTSSATVLSAGEGKYDPCKVATDLSNLVVPRVKDQ